MPKSTIILVVAAAVAGAAIVSGIWSFTLASHSSHPAAVSTHASTGPSATSTVGPTAAPSASGASLSCPSATKHVSTAAQLKSALAAAAPGDVIDLDPGTYEGNFVASKSGTSTSPIWLCGGSGSVLDGKTTSNGYVFHIDHASYWNLVGFTVRDGQKGVVTDGSSYSNIDGLTVTDLGDEGIHLRENSTYDTVRGNTISHTGNLKPKFGEGVYVGTAKSNWCTYTSCQPDKSDHNTIIGNTIFDTTAENVDIKEGTTAGQILDNSFNGAGLVEPGADAWVNVKGNYWIIDGNKGVDSVQDGFQTHQILAGWGNYNTFSNNTATVNGPGYGFHLTPALSNVFECNNVTTGATRGASNIKCTSG